MLLIFIPKFKKMVKFIIIKMQDVLKQTADFGIQKQVNDDSY